MFFNRNPSPVKKLFPHRGVGAKADTLTLEVTANSYVIQLFPEGQLVEENGMVPSQVLITGGTLPSRRFALQELLEAAADFNFRIKNDTRPDEHAAGKIILHRTLG